MSMPNNKEAAFAVPPPAAAPSESQEMPTICYIKQVSWPYMLTHRCSGGGGEIVAPSDQLLQYY